MSETASSDIFKLATLSVDYLRTFLPKELSGPVMGIICGSGLGGLADTVQPAPKFEIAYTDIPHFPKSTVTNAAGGLNNAYSVGDIVVLQDHLNLPGLVGFNPLRGPNPEDFGVRFLPLSDAYDLELRKFAHHAWEALDGKSNNRHLHEGVYAFVGGPSYETRAECRMLQSLGADLVGMSTVPEIIVARHCHLRVLALSLVTNKAVLDAGPQGDDIGVSGVTGRDLKLTLEKGKATHEEVLEAGHEAAKDMQKLVQQLVSDLFSQ
ncbi:MAG: hypothetical protein M1836_004250 [Candelina mexicana]|nr:MAG: hypothetical protein M1836_004250 [Candelina mexicana]